MRSNSRALLLLLVVIHPDVLWAQSQFGNQMIYAGTTCPPTLTPGGNNGGAGSLYTCTGTGALYNWTGSAWSLVTGSGGGGIGVRLWCKTCHVLADAQAVGMCISCSESCHATKRGAAP